MSPFSIYSVKNNGSPGSPPSLNRSISGYGFINDELLTVVKNTVQSTKTERILCRRLISFVVRFVRSQDKLT